MRALCLQDSVSFVQCSIWGVLRKACCQKPLRVARSDPIAITDQ